MIATVGGICDSLWRKIIILNLTATLINILDSCDSGCDDLLGAIL